MAPVTEWIQIPSGTSELESMLMGTLQQLQGLSPGDSATTTGSSFNTCWIHEAFMNVCLGRRVPLTLSMEWEKMGFPIAQGKRPRSEA